MSYTLSPVETAVWPLSIRVGDAFGKQFGYVEPGGRVIDDLILTDGSAVATSASAAFTLADDGELITVPGGGVADGTTMTYVDATTVTLSAAASTDRTDAAALLRPLNCSSWSSHLAQLRKLKPDTSAIVAFTVDSSRSAYGLFRLTLTSTITAALEPQRCIYDWQATTDLGVKTLFEGPVSIRRDASRV